MAVSFRIATALLALVVFALLYAVVGDVVSVVGPLASGATTTSDGSDLYTWTSRIWGLLPVFGLLAAGAYILKQAVVVR